MNMGLRTILLLVAVVLFVLAWLVDDNFTDFLTLGLAAFAGAFLSDALGFADRTFGSTTRSDDTT
jgi:hypothetical protein